MKESLRLICCCSECSSVRLKSILVRYCIDVTNVAEDGKNTGMKREQGSGLRFLLFFWGT